MNSSMVMRVRRAVAGELLPASNESISWFIFAVSKMFSESRFWDFRRSVNRSCSAGEFRNTPSSDGHERSLSDGSEVAIRPMPTRLFAPLIQLSIVSRVGDRSGRRFVLALRTSRSFGLRIFIVSASSLVPWRIFAGIE